MADDADGLIVVSIEPPSSKEDEPEDQHSSAPIRRWTAFGLPPRDVLVLALVAFLCVAVLPPVNWLYWTPRTALLLVALGPGLVALALRVRERDTAAICAALFLAWMVLAAVLSPDRDAALIGDLGFERSAIVLVATIGCWALGSLLSARGRDLLAPVLLSALGVSGVIGVLQVTGALQGRLGSSVDGRASGLTDSPIFFGPLVAGGAVLAAALLAQQRRQWVPIAATAFFAMCVNLSGTRVALGALVVGTFLVAWRATRRHSVVVIAAVLAGLFLSTLVPGAESAGSRLRNDVGTDAPVAGLTPRLEAWKAAGSAIVDRPLLGYGPGQFPLATSKHLSLDFAVAEGPDRVFIDAHFLLIEYATTTGLPGALLLGLLILTLSRRARGPLALFGLVVAITWTLEPASQNTAPLVLIALAAADQTARRAIRIPALARLAIGTTATVGLLTGASLVVGNAAIYQFHSTRSPGDLARAERWLPSYPYLSDLRTGLLVEEALASGDRHLAREAIASAERTVSMRDGIWIHWVRLGEIEGTFGDNVAAAAHFQQALLRYPWSEGGWRGVAIVAVGTGDPELFAVANERLCQLRSALCDTLNRPR